MLPLKVICDRRSRRIGNPICIQYCFKTDERTLLNTDIYIPIRYWNRKSSRVMPDLPAEFGDSEMINKKIKLMLRCIEDLIGIAQKQGINPLNFVRKMFSPDLDFESFGENKTTAENIRMVDADNKKAPLNIYDQIDQYIISKSKKTCKDMPRIYRNMRDHLKDFEAFRKKPISFECLDLSFYEDFVEFLMYDYVQKRRKAVIVGLKTNTVGKTIKQFRTFLRNRIRKKIIPPIDMDGWKILEEEVDAVYLSWPEISLINRLDLSKHAHLINYRNDLILGCLTGLRFSDFSVLEEYDLRGDMLYKKQQKSEHWVVIPLRNEASVILKNRFKQGVQTPTNAEFNRHIKTIAKLAGITQLVKHSYKKGNKTVIEVKPKCEWITSHTCRRSFCTNEFLAGTPVELIMKISGHKSVKDFYKYIRITPEEAGKKMKEIWTQRGEIAI